MREMPLQQWHAAKSESMGISAMAILRLERVVSIRTLPGYQYLSTPQLGSPSSG